jgi:hypothetical protein
MKLKTILLSGLLALGTISIATAKSYDIVISSVTKVGSIQLKPGEYNVKVEGNKAIFTQVETSKSFTTDVKVENAEKKFDQTRMETSQDGDATILKDIQLGGSKTQLDF